MQTASYLSHNDAERTVLGAALQDPLVVKRCMALSTNDFLTPAHRDIFAAVQRLYTQGKAVDLITVDDDLAGRGLLEGIGGSAYLVQLTQYVPTTANTQAYIDTVRDHSNRRRLCDIAVRLHGAAQDGAQEVSGIIDEARSALRGLETGGRAEFVSITDVLIKTYETMERRMAGLDAPANTGIPSFDGLFYGFVPGELTIIGARPSVGKSAFAASVATYAAKKDARVVIVSLEMSDVQYGQRLLAGATDIEAQKIRHAALENDELLVLADAMKGLSLLPIEYLFRTRKIERLYQAVQRRVEDGGLDLLVIDYLQLLRTNARAENENVRVAHISRLLKEMSVEFKIPVIALSQLSRDSQRQGMRKPVLSDLRDSGAIEQDADNVIMLHRPDKADDQSVDDRDRAYFDNYVGRELQYLHIGVEKQRQGPVGGTNVLFDPRHMRYLGIDRR